MNKIEIKGNEYKIKYTIRALFLFEEIANKQFKIETTLDNYLFFYCMILANNPDCGLEWNDFLDAIDEDPKIFVRMNEIVLKLNKIDDLIADDKEEPEKKN